MAIDRARRDAAAMALAAFLRGEIDQVKLGTQFHHLEEIPSESKVPDTFLNMLLHEGVFLHAKDGTGPISFIPKQQWPPVLRELAFLKSDLTNEFEKGPDLDALDRPQQILHARWHALVMLLVLIPSYLISWWISVVAWVCSCVIYQISMQRRDKALRIAAKVDERDQYFPFTTLQDWKEHEALLESFLLPTYEHSPFVPVRQSAFKRFVHSVGFGLSAAAAFLAMGFMYASLIMLWPIWMLAMALSSRKSAQT